MMNSLQYLSYGLMVMIIVIIFSFLVYSIRINFFRFQKQIEVEKLLGAPYVRIIAPFLLSVVITLVGAFILTFLYLWWVAKRLNIYFLEVFSQNIFTLLPANILLWQYSGLEIIVILILSVCFATIVLGKLLRKV